jgi:hypothetical protein
MRTVLTEILGSTELLIFDNAPDAIAFLNVHGTQTLLISLDHDLGPAHQRDGQPFDPGDGRDVAAFLANCKPSCPIIVHSANYQMAPVMIEMLREAGWFAGIVTPYSQLALAWIEGEWRTEIEWLIANGRIKPNKTTNP